MAKQSWIYVGKGDIMKKNIYYIIVMVFSYLSITSTVIAEEEGNYRKGLYYYKNTCKKCHNLSEIGDGKSHQPHTRCITQKDWITNIKSKKFDMYGCKKIEEEICDKNLKHVYKYLHTPSEEEPYVTNCRVISVN